MNGVPVYPLFLCLFLWVEISGCSPNDGRGWSYKGDSFEIINKIRPEIRAGEPLTNLTTC